MLKGKKIVVVLPAYNAARTLEQTYREIPHEIVDEVVLVDDASADNTVEVGKMLGIKHVLRHETNRGYGANQKTCYQKALELNAEIVIMLHPDYQYDPRLILPMASLIADEVYPVVLGSRILGNGALKGGMPFYKYIFNRLLTLFQNLMCGQKLSEYHTGYRAFSKEVFKKIPFTENSDDFIFDNQMISQIIYAQFPIAEITCPTKYFPEASSINFNRSVKYGLGVLKVSLAHRMQLWGLGNFKIYQQPKRSATL